MGREMGHDMGNEQSSSVINWDDLAGSVSQLDTGRRMQLADALRQLQSADHDRAIVGTVREVLAQEQPDREAVAVVFSTSGWDNRYFLESSGLVLYADTSTDDIDIDDIDFGDIAEVFTDEFGMRGPQFGLAVNLRTGDVDTDDYIDNLYDAHGYPFPGRR